ncbi:hypothetical protein BKA93DRAFT_695119, partial [Sparassis latifolia]
SEWDKKGEDYDSPPAFESKENGGIIIKDAPNAMEEVPSSRSHRNWVLVVWLMTFWIPDFCLMRIGRMKHPDVRLAWREKFVIFVLIVTFNGFVIFYIMEFGCLLCPNYDKAWNPSHVAQHTGINDSIQG